jgi:putative ABC transport system ATP-binding protein
MHRQRGGPPVVELCDAQRVYRAGESNVIALDRIDFRLEHGEYCAIIGASGSGKSTLLNVVGTLDRLDGGSYRLNGSEASGLSDAELSRLRCLNIGFVFQAFHLLPLSTALENVELPLVYAGVARVERRERARQALLRVGLSAREHHLPSQLSAARLPPSMFFHRFNRNQSSWWHLRTFEPDSCCCHHLATTP